MKVLKKKNIFNGSGITLIALIITMIVLFIIVGIAISMIISGNGIIIKSGNAKQINRIEGAKEMVELIATNYSINYFQDTNIDENKKIGDYVAKDLYNNSIDGYPEFILEKEENSRNLLLKKDSIIVARGEVKDDGHVEWNDNLEDSYIEDNLQEIYNGLVASSDEIVYDLFRYEIIEEPNAEATGNVKQVTRVADSSGMVYGSNDSSVGKAKVIGINNCFFNGWTELFESDILTSEEENPNIEYYDVSYYELDDSADYVEKTASVWMDKSTAFSSEVVAQREEKYLKRIVFPNKVRLNSEGIPDPNGKIYQITEVSMGSSGIGFSDPYYDNLRVEDDPRLYEITYQNECIIIVPNGVETIAPLGFAFLNIDNLYLPNTLKKISLAAFTHSFTTSDSSYNYGTLTLPNSVKYFGESAFLDCYISNLIYPSTINYIGEGAMSGSLIESFVIPDRNN